MAEIPLSKGKFAIVDDADYERISQFKWYINNSGYAVRKEPSPNVNGKRVYGKTVFMHRQINETPDGMFTDHLNSDRLDNRRHNLRNCTKSQNRMNTSSRGGSSKYKGVTWFARDKKWKAQSSYGGRHNHLGHFENEEDAALAYNFFALANFGEYAQLNTVG